MNKHQPDKAALRAVAEKYVRGGSSTYPTIEEQLEAIEINRVYAFEAGARWAYDQGFRAGIEAARKVVNDHDCIHYDGITLKTHLLRAVRALLNDKGEEED